MNNYNNNYKTRDILRNQLTDDPTVSEWTICPEALIIRFKFLHELG